MDSNYFVEIKGLRFGFQKSPIEVRGNPYMTRYIVYLGWLCLRLHQFFQGDDDRAPHDHPFWFITFPFAGYIEDVYDSQGYRDTRVVKAWRFHFRKATFRHVVLCAEAQITRAGDTMTLHPAKPFWTFVIAGRPSRMWGFWPRPFKFVPWREWK